MKSRFLFKILVFMAMLAMLATSAHAQPEIFADFSSSSSSGISAERIQMNNVILELRANNPLDPTRPIVQSFVFNVIFEWNPTQYVLFPAGLQDPEAVGCANLSVTVLDAFTRDLPIAGAQVQVGSQSATTDTMGVATFSGLPEGIAGITASAAGYITGAPVQRTLVCGANQATVSLSASGGDTGVRPDQIRIVLTWGEDPRDLDSHLTGPTAAGGESRFHVYYANRSPAGEVAELDLDDVTSFGPETITISPSSGSSLLRPGIYRYSVHHYSGSGTIYSSGTNVNLIMGTGMVRSYSPPSTCQWQGSSDVWTVFELTVDASGNATVLPINECYTSSASGVRSAAQYGEGEDPALFEVLPAK
jgi:hypothetical protein